ncbi:lipocalin family protein [Geminicoccus flavidas]|uniref:lipocalin family protein n=1 Tax=Geminicoccus flavidas TaxID=2506407 RepID=UPI00135ACC8F|nr:lipocalin family protein [Geminicoccus flavidas]
MIKGRHTAGLLVGLVLIGCAPLQREEAAQNAVPEPAREVELERYMGRWYEVARYENEFETDCEGVTADYSLQPDGKVQVVNTCRKGAVDGEVETAKGTAEVVPGSRGAKLEVTFFWPFAGNYWVLDRAPDYSWAIVGDPEREYFWILSRVPVPDQHLMDELLARAEELGYDPDRIRLVAQPPTEITPAELTPPG